MSNWSHLLGTLDVIVVDFEYDKHDVELWVDDKLDKTAAEIKNLLEDYFGPTDTGYTSIPDEVRQRIKVPAGSEGTITYTIANNTDYNRRRRGLGASEYRFHVTFSGPLRDVLLISDNVFKEWVATIDRAVDLNDRFRMVVDNDVWFVHEDWEGTKTFANLISDEF